MSASLPAGDMGYEIIGKKEDAFGRQIHEMEFTSETLVSLHEEIDRFVKEKNPHSMWARSRRLVPEYRPARVQDKRGEIVDAKESNWSLKLDVRV